MAVVVTKDIRRKQLLLAAFAALVLTSASIIYFGMFKESAPSSAVLPLENPVVSGSQVSDLKVKILEDERFKNLLSPPGVPLKTETTGKSNPFSD